WDNEPHYFQLEGTRAQLEGTDMIIQAPTGCGKTAVAAGPHVWPSSKGKITIVISPLLALEEEMVHTFARDFKLSAIAVHNKNGGCSRATAQRLLSDDFQILLVSPEMIQSRTFINRVLRNPKFSRRVLSMVVDEAHCISHWGADFRKKYASLGVICTFLPRNTPVIAMTATLTARARRDIHTKLQFSKGHSRFINIGNDRPNVSIVVRSCEHSQKSYADLDFVIPSTVNTLTDIPKTWVYVDNIATGNEIIDHLEALLQTRINSAGPGDSYSDAIRPFNAVLSLSYRRAAMEAFREGKIQVMVCTDAAGMGCDIPDVEIVVQWMLPKTFSNWIQRAGRAARGRGREGLAVLLVPPAVYKKIIDTSMNVNSQGSGQGTGKGKGSKKEKERDITPEEYAILHGVNRGKRDKQDQKPAAKQPPFDEEAADEGLTVFVQSTRCRREVWAQAFDTQFNRSALTVPCCDICDPSLFNRMRPGNRPRASANAKGPKGRKRGQAVPEIEKRLREWRRMVYQRDHNFAVYEAKSLLSDDMVAVLASHGELELQTFARLLSGSWIWWERYGTKLQDFMKTL
ncbi:P-loop containing nucleoside triphosphate hydrolase protein, partial [Panus rudis PR-1116 ss-1]